MCVCVCGGGGGYMCFVGQIPIFVCDLNFQPLTYYQIQSILNVNILHLGIYFFWGERENGEGGGYYVAHQISMF